jgi:hypothetical protein
MELPYRWNGTEGRVDVEVRVNDDPAALGCGEFARGFPCCTATVDHPAIGYADLLGWVQLLDSSVHEDDIHLDYFEPLGEVPHPFAFYGFAPTFFDAPHSDLDESWDFLAHAFLCGLSGGLFDERREIRAVTGFSWGFSQRGREVEFFEPRPLSPGDWDGHTAYLAQKFPAWTFAPGFHQGPLET